jgi:hypothetical protein
MSVGERLQEVAGFVGRRLQLSSFYFHSCVYTKQ